jgi:hypothetical protein
MTQPQKEPHSQLIQQVLTQVVDDVILHSERVRMGESPPLRSVPYNFSPADPTYGHLSRVQSVNEVGEPAGRFGWCIECRRGADLYCKD